MNNKNTMCFIRSFLSLIENGCTVRESLEMLAFSNTGNFQNNVIQQISKKILTLTEQGITITEALNEANAFSIIKWKKYLLLCESTGRIDQALTLIKLDIERRNKIANQIGGALLYPLVVLMFSAIIVIAILKYGIPWLEQGGMIKDPALIEHMKRGLIISAIFPISSASLLGFIGFTVLINAEKIESYWSLLDYLAQANILFDHCLTVCESQLIKNKTHKIKDETGLIITCNFERMLIETAKITGDFPSVFKQIAEYHRIKIENLYENTLKTAEPVLLLITGITVLIITITVFYPLLNHSGGFL